MNITEQEILDLIRQTRPVPENPEGAMTVAEIVKQSGKHIDRVRAELREHIEAGRVDVVKVYRKALDGVMRLSPAYRVKGV